VERNAAKKEARKRIMSSPISIDSLIAAIAQGEGANSPGTIPNTTGNVTDLEIGDIGYGTVSAAGGNQITSFGGDSALGTSEAEGYIGDEVYNEQNGLTPPLTLSQYLQQWETGSTQGGGTLMTNVPSILGVPGSTPLTSFGQIAGTASGTPSASGAALSPVSGTSTLTQAQQAAQALQGAGTTSTGSGWLAQIQAQLAKDSAAVAAVVVGLVLIAGAVFGFKNLGNTVVGGVKKGAEAALL
jgi:hypothetical protein